MNASDYRAKKNAEILQLIHDAYILGTLYGRGFIPQLEYRSDLKEQTALIRAALSKAVHATAP